MPDPNIKSIGYNLLVVEHSNGWHFKDAVTGNDLSFKDAYALWCLRTPNNIGTVIRFKQETEHVLKHEGNIAILRNIISSHNK